MASRSSRVAPGASIFARLFPFRLKFSGITSRRDGVSALPAAVSGFRQFSSVTRARGGRSASFSRERRDDSGRGRELRLGGVGGKVQQSKSLIDDEAELSDWISDLRTDGLPRLSDDSDDGGGAYSSRKRRADDPPAARNWKENELGRRKIKGSGPALGNVDWEGEAAGPRGARTAGRKQLASDSDGKKRGGHLGYNSQGGREGEVSGKRKMEYGKRTAQIVDDGDDFEGDDEKMVKKRGSLGYNHRNGREGGVLGKRKMEYGKRTAQIVDDGDDFEDEDKEMVKKRGSLGYNTRNAREGGVLGKRKMEYGKRAAQIVDDNDDDDDDGDDGSGFESDFLSGEDSEAGSDDALLEDKVTSKKSRDEVVVPKYHQEKRIHT